MVALCGLCILPYWAVSLGVLGVLDDRVLGGLARGFGLGGLLSLPVAPRIG